MNASKKNMSFKGAFLLYINEKSYSFYFYLYHLWTEYSWLLMYKKNTIVTKTYMVTSLDQLNLKVELNKNTLAKKIENLTEIDVI